MIKPTNKLYVVYHSNCLDGFGAAFATWLSLGDHAEYIPLDYTEREKIFDYPLEGGTLYIFDFSFTREQMDRLESICGRIVWRDHHESAFKEFAGEEREYWAPGPYGQKNYLLNNSRSGALLAWDYWNPTAPTPLIFNYIDDRDRWQWQLEDTMPVTRYLTMLDQDFNVWNDVAFETEKLLEKGKLLDEYYQQQLSRAIEATKEPCSIFGAEGLCCNLPPLFASEAGNLLAKESGTFGATWFKDKDGNIKWSLRSIGDYNVAELAARFGGGGHRNAAGFVLRPESGLTEKGVKVWHT